MSSRLRQGRVDQKHAWIDPILVAGPWVIGGALAFAAGRAVLRAGRR